MHEISSHLRVLGLKKWAISGFWHVIVDFEPIWSWAISKSHAYAFTWQHLLRWLFEPSQGPSRKYPKIFENGKSKIGNKRLHFTARLMGHCVQPITRGSLRWLKKSSKEVLSREGICMRFWDVPASNWLKISITCQKSEMAHFFRPETLRWLKIRII